MQEILNLIVENIEPVVTLAIVGAVGYGLTQLRALVKSTENQWDDKVLAAFEAGLEKGLKATPSENVAAIKPAEDKPAE